MFDCAMARSSPELPVITLSEPGPVGQSGPDSVAFPSVREGRGTMPTVTAERLTEIEIGLLVAAGASPEEAAIIARYNVGANLVGHDSHGVILIPTYIDRVK